MQKCKNANLQSCNELSGMFSVSEDSFRTVPSESMIHWASIRVSLDT